jgi:hypothetical protein
MFFIFLPPNGLRLSGERMRVRCSRGFGAGSERLDLDTFSRKPRFGCALLLAVKIEDAHLGHTRELVLAGTLSDSYPRLLGSNELPVLVEPQRDVCRVEFSVANPLPCTMGYAEYRMRISTSEERSIRREREEYYALTPRATG